MLISQSSPLFVDFVVNTLKVFPTLSQSVRNWHKGNTKEDMITWRKSCIGNCKKYDLESKDKWYEHVPLGCVENDTIKLLWDINVQCDHVIEARRPDIILVDKENKVCTIIDVAVPGDIRVGEKETEKVEKYQDLKREIAKIWKMKEVKVVPIVVGALGSVSRSLGKWIDKLGIKIKTEFLQRTALLGTARILRKVLER